jgi:flagellar hook-basal body complex protein FliE
MSAAPIVPIEAASLLDRSSLVHGAAPPTGPSAATSFAQLLTNGIDNINKKAMDADNMVRAFALDDSVPVHQVTYALDQAKGAMELALQVRARLLDGYQQIMNMQL